MEGVSRGDSLRKGSFDYVSGSEGRDNTSPTDPGFLPEWAVADRVRRRTWTDPPRTDSMGILRSGDNGSEGSGTGKGSGGGVVYPSGVHSGGTFSSP